MERRTHRSRWYSLFLLGLITAPLWGMVPGAKKMSKRSDLEVVKALGSRNHEEAAAAEKEVIKRGERMIPLLLGNRGDTRHYEGGGLGVKKTSSWAFFIPKEGQVLTAADPPGLPVEVASLYLISRIYYGHFDFAGAPVLAYRASPDAASEVINNHAEMMRRAYEAYDEWVRKVKSQGLHALRKRNEPPLAGTQFHWW